MIHACFMDTDWIYSDLPGVLLSQPRWAKTCGPRDHKLVKRILKDAGLDDGDDDMKQ